MSSIQDESEGTTCLQIVTPEQMLISTFPRAMAENADVNVTYAWLRVYVEHFGGIRTRTHASGGRSNTWRAR